MRRKLGLDDRMGMRIMVAAHDAVNQCQDVVTAGCSKDWKLHNSIHKELPVRGNFLLI
jgi:hypothetical protein